MKLVPAFVFLGLITSCSIGHGDFSKRKYLDLEKIRETETLTATETYPHTVREEPVVTGDVEVLPGKTGEYRKPTVECEVGEPSNDHFFSGETNEEDGDKHVQNAVTTVIPQDETQTVIAKKSNPEQAEPELKEPSRFFKMQLISVGIGIIMFALAALSTDFIVALCIAFIILSLLAFTAAFIFGSEYILALRKTPKDQHAKGTPFKVALSLMICSVSGCICLSLFTFLLVALVFTW